MKPQIIIGICGGTGAGKSTLVGEIKKYFSDKATCISHDSYYKDQSNLSLEERQKTNYDHPDSLETNLLIKHLIALKSGHKIAVPVYDFTVSNRTEETTIAKPQPIIIVEGILIFANATLRSMFDIKIFVDAEADVRLGRRIKRDIQERQRTLDFSLNQYLTVSKPMHDQFVEPYKRLANLIVPEGGHNQIAIQMILAALDKYLK